MTEKYHVIESEWDYNGLHCVIVFNGNTCSRCGYVGIPKNNPYYNHSSFIDNGEFSVHGGITFDEIGSYPVKYGKDTRWIGFDCAHCDDLQDLDSFNKYIENGDLVMPEAKANAIRQVVGLGGLHFYTPEDGANEWDEGSVGVEVENLADQVAVSIGSLLTKKLKEGKTLQEAAKECR